MRAQSAKIAEAHECGTRAWLASTDAHAAAFAGDAEAAKKSIREAVAAHRDAINLLVAALPDCLEETKAREF
jgi:hypothetical protein